ncbi:hypothetical protein L9F63_018342, partial [Diploptera punctata]
CTSKKFVPGFSSHSLGNMRLKTFPYQKLGVHSVFNISMRDIKWTVFRFRFVMLGGNLSFCREYQLSAAYHIDEIFYDCLSTPSDYETSSFTFEYQAEDDDHNTQTRKFILKVPRYDYI